MDDSGNECNDGAQDKSPDEAEVEKDNDTSLVAKEGETIVIVSSGKKNPTFNKLVDLFLSGKCESVKFAEKVTVIAANVNVFKSVFF